MNGTCLFIVTVFVISSFNFLMFVAGHYDLHNHGDICTFRGVIKKRSRSSPAKYYMQVPNGKPTAYVCPSGQRFSVDRCLCVSPDALRFEAEAERELFPDKLADVGKEFPDCPDSYEEADPANKNNLVVNAQNATGWARLHSAAWYGSLKVVRALLEQGANIFIENNEKEQPMHLAALGNHVPVMEALYDAGGDLTSQRRLISAKNRHGQTPFFYAIKGRALVAASKLLDFGAAVDAVDLDRMEPIHYAIRHDQRETVEFLVRHGARLRSKCCLSPRRRNGFQLGAEYNAADTFGGRLNEQLETYVRQYKENGRRLMCIAAEKGSLGFARELLKIDPKLAYQSRCHFGDTRQHYHGRRGGPLHVASYYGHVVFVEYLLKKSHDVNVDEPDSAGSTPLMEAIRSSASNELIQLLLDNNARVDIRDKFGRTPFLVAADRSLVTAAKMLINQHANPFAVDNKGQSAFHLTPSATFLDYLLTHRRAIDYIDAKTNMEAGGLTPLHYAVIERKSSDFIALLIENGADPTKSEEWNRYTPLHFAIETGQNSVVQMLLRHRNVCSRVLIKNDRFGRTVFHLAIARNNVDAAKSLLSKGSYINELVEHGCGETALHIAARNGYLDAIEFLVGRGADCSVISLRDKRTALMEAIFWRNFDAARILLRCEDRRDLLVRDHMGRNALHIAVLQGHVQTARALVETARSADRSRALLGAADYRGDTPLHYAVRMNNLEMIAYLLETDADCNLRNKDGRTPLHVAAYLGQIHIVREFHSRGTCELAQPDTRGRLVLEYSAMRRRKLLVEEIIKSYGTDSCTSVSIRLLMAVRLKMRAFVSLLLLENQGRCDLRELFMAKHKHGHTLFDYALMERDINLLMMAFDLDVVDVRPLRSSEQLDDDSSDQSRPKSQHRHHRHRGRRGRRDHPIGDNEVSRAEENSQEKMTNVTGGVNNNEVGRRARRDLSGAETGTTMLKQLIFGPRIELLSNWILAMQRQLVDADSVKCVEFTELEQRDIDETAMVSPNGDDDDDKDDNEEDGDPKRDEARRQATSAAVQLLIDKTGVDVNAEIDENGNRLLHYLAVDGCNLAATFALLERKADPNAVNKAGLTPLHLAALSKNKCAARFAEALIRQGAAADATASIRLSDGDSQLTPVHLAASRCGNIQVIDAFIGLTVKRQRKESGDDGGHLLLSRVMTVTNNGSQPAITNDTTMTPIDTTTIIMSTTPQVQWQSVDSANASVTVSSYLSHGEESGGRIKIALSPNNGGMMDQSSTVTDLTMLVDEKAVKAKLQELLKKTKFGKTVSLMAIENNRFDVLQRLEEVGGEEFSIFKSPTALAKPRRIRDLPTQKQPGDAFGACRYVVNQCEKKISDLVESSSTCCEQLGNYRHLETNSLDLVRRAIHRSSDLIDLKGATGQQQRKKFYFIHEASVSADDAEIACLNRGATLAQIGSEAESQLFKSIDKTGVSSSASFWIGLRRGSTDRNTFWWNNGVQLSPDQEIDSSSSNAKCATLQTSDSGFTLSANSCENQAEGAVCELEFPKPTFWIIRGSFTWRQAQEACRENINSSLPSSNNNYGLAMPKSRIVLEALLKMNGWPEQQSGWQGCWVGLRRSQHSDDGRKTPKFMWDDRTYLEPIDNIPWMVGQPAAVGGPDDCVELFGLKHMEPTRPGRFNDLPCDFRLDCAICYREFN